MSTKVRILEHTVSLIKKEGVENISGRRICNDLKINVSSIKYHFNDKDNLINQALQLMTEDFSHITEVLFEASKPIEERLEIFILKLADEIEKKPDVVAYLLEGKSRHPMNKHVVMSNDALRLMHNELNQLGYGYSVEEIRMKVLQIISAIAYPIYIGLFKQFNNIQRQKYLILLLDIFINRVK